MALLLVLLGSGCRQQAAEFAATVRDSSGVRITYNAGLAALPPLRWTLEPEPRVDISGTNDGPPAPYQVTAAVRLAGGRIAVASSGTAQILVYNADGRFIRALGRRGDGPGEFRSIFGLAAVGGDTLAAWDPIAGRATLFAPDGSLVRTVAPRAASGTFATAFGWLASGSVVLGLGSPAPPPASARPAVTRGSMEIVTAGGDGSAIRTLGRFPGTEMAAIRSPAGGLLVRPLPFGRQTLAAVHGNRIYVATADAYEVRGYGPHGLEEIVRGDRVPVPVRPRDILAYRRSLVVVGGEGFAQPARDEQRLLAEVPYPATMPPIGAIAADSAGRIWVKDASAPGAWDRWTVFAPGGGAAGTLSLPSNVRITQIGSDWLLAIHVDADHVEHVRLYRFKRH